MDTRNGTSDIYGARVSPAGTVLDATGLAISTAASGQDSPAVAWNGTNYLVVWMDTRNGTTADIYGTRVSAAGTVLDASGLALCTATNHQQFPSVASDGTSYLVTWADFRNGGAYDIYGTRVSAAGTVLDATGLVLSAAANHQLYPALAWDGTNYLVTWVDIRSGGDYDIYGTRVSAAGTALDSAGLLISTETNQQNAPAVAWDGTNYLMVWQDIRSGATTDIYGARVSATGIVLDASGLALSTAAFFQYAPALAWDGTNYLVVWKDLRSGSTSDIFATRVSAAGAVLDPGGFAVSSAPNTQESPSVAWGGTNYLVTWQDFPAEADRVVQ